MMGEQAFVVGDEVCAKGAVAVVVAIHGKLVTYRFKNGTEFRDYVDFLQRINPADPTPAQPVAEWRDISGNDHALSQADAEHQPVIVPSPPAQPDDEQARAIRERLAKFDRFASTEGDVTTMEMVFSEDVRFLLARLDAVQAERDALLRHAISMASALDMEGLDDNDAVRYVKRLMTKESDDANAG